MSRPYTKMRTATLSEIHNIERKKKNEQTNEIRNENARNRRDYIQNPCVLVIYVKN